MKHIRPKMVFMMLLFLTTGMILILIPFRIGDKDSSVQFSSTFEEKQIFTATPGYSVQSETDTPYIIATSHINSLSKPTITPEQTSTIISFTSKMEIGKSIEGRPIELFRFGTGSIRKLIIGGIHGGYEINTINLAHEFIDYFEKHPTDIPEDVTLYILPSLNPDGQNYQQGPDGRGNANKVDLNRNFDADWQSVLNNNGCWHSRPLTGGTAPFSEPETQAIRDFILNYDIDALISYHSAGLGIFAGGKQNNENSVNLARELAALGIYQFPPVDTGCIYTGQLIDWASDKGIIALDVELSNHIDTEFASNLKLILLFLNSNY